MYIASLLTIFTEALRKTFDSEFNIPEFRNLWISPEYPKDSTKHFPGIWVDYTPMTDLHTVGIGHIEYSAPGPGGEVRKGTRWNFQGVVQLTMMSWNPLERARLADALTSVVAFGYESPDMSQFRAALQDNDLIGLRVQWDQFGLGGKAESPGTPWGSEEDLYEITATLTVEGEFVWSGTQQALIPLSAVQITGIISGDADPTTPDDPDDPPEFQWH